MRPPALCLPLFFPLLCLHSQSPAPVQGILEGNVINATAHAPIANARLRLSSGSNDPVYGKTDRQGHFVISNLPLAVYQLTVESPGFLQSPTSAVDLTAPKPSPNGALRSIVTSYPPNLRPQAKVEKSTDADGAVRATATVPLLANAVLTGKITDPYGLPMKNCTVQVLMKQPPAPSGTPSPRLPGNSGTMSKASVAADDRGQYRVALEPGTYWILAGKQGRGFPETWEDTSRPTYYPAATSLDDAKPLTLAAGQSIEADIQIVKVAGVRISGKLIKPAGAPDPTVVLPGGGLHSMLYTNVALMPAGSVPYTNGAPFTTGQDDYQFKGVLPGRYTLTAVTRDALSDPGGENQKALFGLTREIEVGRQDMDGFDLALEPLHDVAGEISFAEGCPADPLSIQASNYSPAGGPQVKTTSGADGKFVLTGLTAGRIYLNVNWPSGPPGRVSSIRLGERDVMADGFDVPYSGRDVLRVNIECSPLRRMQ